MTYLRIAATVALALLYAPLFPAAAGRLPKRTALQPLGQITLIDPAFGIIMRILIHTVFVAARAMTIAQITRHLAEPLEWISANAASIEASHALDLGAKHT